MRELSFLNKGLTIVMTDERSESKNEDGNAPVETFYSERGLSEFVRVFGWN